MPNEEERETQVPNEGHNERQTDAPPKWGAHMALCTLPPFSRTWHPVGISASMMRRGREHSGDIHIFASVFSQLPDAPFRVAALGASLTANFAGDGTCRQSGWLLPVMTLLRSRWKNSTLVNLGLASHSISHHQTCNVPFDASLVFIDAATVPTREAELAASLAVLSRRRPSPAVVMVHFPRWCVPMKKEFGDPKFAIPTGYRLHSTGACYKHARLRATAAAGHLREEALNRLAMKVGAAVLSVGSAFADEVLDGKPGFSPTELTSDGLHPKVLVGAD